VFRLAVADIDSYLVANDTERSALKVILDTFDYDTFKSMQAEWLKRGRMLWFSYGNLTKDQSKQIVEQAVELTGLQTIPKDELPDVRLIDLSSQSNNFHRLDNTVKDANNENSCLVSYYQYGRDECNSDGKLDLLNRITV